MIEISSREADPDPSEVTVSGVSEETEIPVFDEGANSEEGEDEDLHEITVQTGSSWYPPLPIPEGVDEDNFQGSDNHPLHRGRWIIFLGYNKENSGSPLWAEIL